jgi:hypothetical protein
MINLGLVYMKFKRFRDNLSIKLIKYKSCNKQKDGTHQINRLSCEIIQHQKYY